MRALKLSLAVFLLVAGTADAQRLDGLYFINGDEETIDNAAALTVDETTFYVQGNVQGFGTDGDVVEIGYFSNAPTHVNADETQARVRQDQLSELTFEIDSEVPERDFDLTINPAKCSIDAKVDTDKSKGSVTVKCSGDNLFADISASQLASIQTAFANTKNVKIKVKSDGSKGSLVITLKGLIPAPV